MASRNTSHLAGEFLVAGELSRRGYPVSITMGNAKAVDIYATAQNDEKFTVDAKAARTKSWLVGNVDEKLYYIFVYLQTKNKVDRNTPPEYFVATGKDILRENLIETFGEVREVRYKTLEIKDANGKYEYKERWDNLPDPP